jgi:hypothetical protein
VKIILSPDGDFPLTGRLGFPCTSAIIVNGGHLGWAPSALKRFAHRRSIPAQLRHLTIAIALVNSGSLDLPLSAT